MPLTFCLIGYIFIYLIREHRVNKRKNTMKAAAYGGLPITESPYIMEH